MPATRSVDLLAAEVDVLWDRDARGRLRQAHHVVFGVAGDGQVLAVGDEVPDDVADDLAKTLDSAVEGVREPAEPRRPPEFLAYCRRRIVGALGPVVVSSGPSYLVPRAATTPIDGRTYDEASVRIVRSDDEAAARDALRAANPDTWTGEEWADLLAGRLGPWAVATHDTRVLAVAHTPVADSRGAEAGVWTHPDVRGRGLAGTVTAHWARLIRGTGRLPFYSTSADNLSSQRVAARLALRPIGWLWKLSSPDRVGVHAHRTWQSC
ncbi:GNAT acetyltransferase [Actinopolymorpha cephalotaxi]|uniref:GNAT acetyltransferase n=1 Tax=Actinopolymorpha cephalotaxi TaxID=504797 RepID=A0A1I3BFM0_9ACTN|nr:GNAT family N-acetyltransferase [Actinopolymorpha cephalotaxi]NYH86356.1 RimJ/RimL family protein N-acetyltransferase [Actinopolymorpha cephalotaxi]SFH60950.1 GNAT acetyltransferase [Actinopolymorpha cephalotaxi]